MATTDNSDFTVDKVKEMRMGLAEIERRGLESLPPLSVGLEEFWIGIPTSDGWESRCKVIRPQLGLESTPKAHPLIVYFHGGGYILGSPEMVTRPAREWAEAFGATVVCPSYRLAPEWKWPTFMKDAWDVVAHLSEHAENDERLGAVKLSDGFVVGGISAGGGLAAVVGGVGSLLESDMPRAESLGATRLSKPITGLFVSIALLITEEMVPLGLKHLWKSREENRDSQTLSADNLDLIIAMIHCTDHLSPWFSPVGFLNELTDSKTGAISLSHPPTCIHSCGQDPLRDDAIIYKQLLDKLPGMAGKTKIVTFPDDDHTGWTALQMATKSQNPSHEEATMQGMQWLLETK